MEVLSSPLHCLIHYIVCTLFGKFVQEAAYTCVTDDVNCAIEIVGVHHRLNVREDVLTRSERHYDSVRILGIDEGVLEHLALVCTKGGKCCGIKRGTKNAGALEVLLCEVILIVNLVVGIHSLYHSKAYGIGGEGNAYES